MQDVLLKLDVARSLLAQKAKLARAKSEAFETIYLYRVGDGNQREVTADFSLESLGAPSILQFPQNLNRYERNRRVFAVHGEVTAPLASMQSITHQLSLFGQNDGEIVLALAFKFVVGISVMYI